MNCQNQEKINILLQNTLFYRNKSICFDPKTVIELPLVCKQDLQFSYNDLISDKEKNRPEIEYMKIRSSGSTGQIVEVLWNERDFVLSNLTLWRLRKKFYNITPTTKYITFHSVIYNGTQVENIANCEMKKTKVSLSINKYFISNDTIDRYINSIIDFAPEWIFTQPSMIINLMSIMKQNNLISQKIFPNIKYIELNGETLLEAQRREISRFFGVPVANLYGATEVNGIAFQCPDGHMHIIEDNVYLQLFNSCQTNDGIIGDVAITSLWNTKMPIIQYELGDRVKIYNNRACKHHNGKIIDVLIGRTNSRMNVGQNSNISSYDLAYCIERTNTKFGDPILQYKLIRENSKNTLYLFIRTCFNGWKENIKNNVINLLKQFSQKNIDYNCVFIDEPMVVSENGKLKSMENKDEHSTY